MSVPASEPMYNSGPDGEAFLAAKEERSLEDQLKTAVRLISYAQRHQLSAVALIGMAEMLGLDEQLDELAATSPEHQRSIAAARAELARRIEDRRATEDTGRPDSVLDNG
jgi:hypothetical protein